MTGELVPGGADTPDFSRLEALRAAWLPFAPADFTPPTTVEESYTARVVDELDSVRAENQRVRGMSHDASVDYVAACCVLGTVVRPTPLVPATRAAAVLWRASRNAA